MPNENKMAGGMSSVVSSTMGRLMPSMPRWYEALMAANHGADSSNLKHSGWVAGQGVWAAYSAHSSSAKAKGTRVVMSVTHRIARTWADGMSSTTMAPASGVKRM